MIGPSALLLGKLPAGVWPLETPFPEDALASVYMADCSSVSSKNDLLQILEETLQLPSWFGHNWDALEEALHDGAWLRTDTPTVLAFDNADRLTSLPTTDYLIFVDLLSDVTGFWARKGRLVYVTLLNRVS